MMTYFDLSICFFLRAPILASSGASNSQGVDNTFFRDSNGKIALQRSHIKGKLRESLLDLDNIYKIEGFSMDEWFGTRIEDDAFDRSTSKLIFSDFLLDHTELLNTSIATRVSINNKTGTTKERFLQMNEQLFAPGSLSRWIGHIYFWAESKTAADNIASIIKLGFKWITAFGSMKGSGYGRIEEVKTDLKVWEKIKDTSISTNNKFYSLYIEMEDDLFIGGNVNSSNYRESEKYIPGIVLKGSLARCLNEMCGSNPDFAIDVENKNVKSSYPNIAKYFSHIHFTHAFPSPAFQDKRPIVIPFSTIYTENQDYRDVALLDKINITKNNNKAPLYQIDWKDDLQLKKKFGWEVCSTVNRTRTSIEKRRRTAKENQLYTFQYISPYSKSIKNSDLSPGRIIWISNIILPVEHTNEIASELFEVMNIAWNYLGKRNSRFKFHIKEGKAIPKITSKDDKVLLDNIAIITLQSDALMFDEYVNQFPINLLEIYQKYWSDATKKTCRLVNLFARQKMVGRYYGIRFKKLHNNNYYPFILTEAGSVFILEANDVTAAANVLRELRDNGLPLPNDIQLKISQLNIEDIDTWKICPFVKENGYGEIVVNLDWHWNKKFEQ